MKRKTNRSFSMIRALTFAFCLLLPLSGMAQPFLPGTPQAGIDYEVLPTAQATYGKGKIEVAEVFSYGCIHCFHFQPIVNTWRQTMPADVRWEYVPAAFGGPHDNFARAFLAAQVLGVQQKTHDAVFKAVFVDGMVKTGSADEMADIYAKLGVNRAKFLSTMQGAKVTADLAHAKDFSLRTGISGTPTIIVNGRYRVMGNNEGGLKGVFKTVDFLIARERQRAASDAAKRKG
jgi:thiol:disulfide interchange protein DsbA